VDKVTGASATSSLNAGSKLNFIVEQINAIRGVE
jgi:hypothetical protein